MSHTVGEMIVERVGTYPKHDERWAITIDGKSVLITPFGGRQVIVRATAHRYNCHDKLLDACKRIDTFLSLDFPKMTPTQWAITVGELKGYLVPIIAAAEPSSHNGKEG
jgi:hypothetical protein